MTRSGMGGMNYQQIAHALKNYSAKAPVIASHYAVSGGSLNAPATDEIVMNPNAAIEPPVSTDMSADVYKLMKLFLPNSGNASLRRASEAASKINDEL
jgi:serine dehydrogenase proteinase